MRAVDRDGGAGEPAGERVDEHRVHVLRAGVGHERVQYLGHVERFGTGESEIVEVERNAGEAHRIRADHDEAGSPSTQRLGQRTQQQVRREVVHREHAREPVRCAECRRGDERGIADHNVRRRCRGQPVGEGAHLVQQGEVGTLQLEVRARRSIGDAVTGRPQAVVVPADEHDLVTFAGQTPGDGLADPVRRPGHDRSHGSPS
jgi:hypothetical protein